MDRGDARVRFLARILEIKDLCGFEIMFFRKEDSSNPLQHVEDDLNVFPFSKEPEKALLSRVPMPLVMC
jgi:hypothetical protein